MKIFKYINNNDRFINLFIFCRTYTLTCIMDPGIIPSDFYLENYDVDN